MWVDRQESLKTVRRTIQCNRIRLQCWSQSRMEKRFHFLNAGCNWPGTAAPSSQISICPVADLDSVNSESAVLDKSPVKRSEFRSKRLSLDFHSLRTLLRRSQETSRLRTRLRDKWSLVTDGSLVTLSMRFFRPYAKWQHSCVDD